MQTLLLSQADIRQVLAMPDVMEIVEKTFIGIAEGTVVNAPRAGLDLGESAAFPAYHGFMNAMPAYVGWLDSAGMKWVGGFLKNPPRGLPYISGMILLIDPHTGQFTAVLEGALITSLRTGAQSAVPLKRLHPGRSLRLGLYGAGAQGRAQVEAAASAFEIEMLRLYDVRREAAEQFAKEMAGVVKGRIVIADRPEEAADADAVICVTQSKDRFFQEAWWKQGSVLFPMGSYQECDDACILKADVILVDQVEQCLQRGALRSLSQAGRINTSNISGTISEVLTGAKPGRTSASQRVLCIPLGTGALDVAVATVAYRRAVERDLGTPFAFI